MIKECEYCGNEFKANRSDTKYCSKSCKQQAYTMRQANPHIAQSQDYNRPIDVNMNHRRKNAKTFTQLSENHLGALLNGSKMNKDVLNHLLAAMKENGHIMSDSSKIEIELMFTKEKLEAAYNKINDLEKENERIYEKLERLDGGVGNRIMSMCESNPQILMMLSPILKKFFPESGTSGMEDFMAGSNKHTSKSEQHISNKEVSNSD